MNRDSAQRNTYIAIAFALIFIIVLCVVSFMIVRPFLASLAWGVILAIATWPPSPGAGSSLAGGPRSPLRS